MAVMVRPLRDQWSGCPAATVLHAPCDLHGSPTLGPLLWAPYLAAGTRGSPAIDRYHGGCGGGKFWNLKQGPRPQGLRGPASTVGGRGDQVVRRAWVSPATGGKRHADRCADISPRRRRRSSKRTLSSSVTTVCACLSTGRTCCHSALTTGPGGTWSTRAQHRTGPRSRCRVPSLDTHLTPRSPAARPFLQRPDPVTLAVCSPERHWDVAWPSRSTPGAWQLEWEPLE